MQELLLSYSTREDLWDVQCTYATKWVDCICRIWWLLETSEVCEFWMDINVWVDFWKHSKAVRMWNEQQNAIIYNGTRVNLSDVNARPQQTPQIIYVDSFF